MPAFYVKRSKRTIINSDDYLGRKVRSVFLLPLKPNTPRLQLAETPAIISRDNYDKLLGVMADF